MNKVKAFFAKVGNYIKNSAWIQPILIVVVIFVVLFSLNPLTNAIKTGWTKITTVNNMEKISFQEYTEMVYEQEDGGEDFVVVFTSSTCDVCPIFYKSVNEYLKTADYGKNFKIYNVDLSLKSTKIKIDGTKYKRYKDTTAGLYSPVGETKQNILNKDYVQDLDKRLQDFVSAFGDAGYSGLTSISEGSYQYVGTPLVIWYSNGIETRVSNNFKAESQITLKPDGKQATASSFKTYITDFAKESNTADYWTVNNAIVKNIKVKFDENGIEMTYPHLNVHLDK